MRDKNGKFQTGGPGGPGRPSRQAERELQEMVHEACPPEVLRRIIDRTVADALDGKATARNWLTERMVNNAAPAPVATDQVPAEAEAGPAPVASDAPAAPPEQRLRIAE